jgi:hypothetical protein
MQAAPEAHALPQAPQFWTSWETDLHTPSHEVCPGGQVQRPPLQILPDAQMLPHPPQLRGSAAASTQDPLAQGVGPAGH